VVSHYRPTWKNAHLAAASTRRNRSVFVSLLALVLALSMYEALLIKPIMDLVLAGSDAESYFVAVMLAVSAATMMLESGYLARKARVDGDRAIVPWLLVLGWLLVGGALFTLRLVPESDGQQLVPPPLLATVIALVYLGAGVLNNAAGRSLFNPVAQAHASARRSRARVEHRIARQRRRVVRAFERLEVVRGDLVVASQLRASAEATAAAYFEQLRQAARLRMVLPLGDPAVTSAVGQDLGGGSGTDGPRIQAVG